MLEANLPLPVDMGKESLVEDGPDVILSGWKLNVKISDVSRGICVVPDQFPVVVPKKAVEPLVLSVVAMTRSQAPALSEVCSLAVLAGGSLLRQTPWQW